MTVNTDTVRSALSSRYAIDQEIGRGGMAIVYRAKDLKLERQVAIKVLRPELSDSLGRDRFLREITIEANLQHPNILTIFDFGEVEGVLYYSMPYVEGESLRERLQRQGQLPVEDALRITSEVAKGLSYAHARGIVHRDIKPGNILVAGEQVLVVDFGIARAITAAGGDAVTRDTVTAGTPTGVAVGTPEYMSPEQVAGDQTIDGRSDLYSLACVLFEMLAGDPPFTGRTIQTVINRQLHEPPPSLEFRRSTAARGVVVAVNKALSKVPADRYEDVTQFMEALRADLPHEDKGRQLARRVAFASVAAFAVFLLWLWQQRPIPSVLDDNKVAVFPLMERGLNPSDEGAGYDAAIMITTAFEKAAPLKWIDVRSRLTEQERLSPDHVSPERAAAIARERRARYYLDGIVRGGDSAAVILRLYDAGADSLVTQASAAAAGPAASFASLGITATKELLSAWIDPGREIDLSFIEERNADAIAFWIRGERAYRMSRFGEALEEYQRSLASDSALVLAAVKASQAANWQSEFDLAHDLAAFALRRAEFLPAKYERFARGLNAYLDGRADTAVYWLERSLELDPEWPEAHAVLGEVYYHLLPLTSDPINGLARAAFESAMESDSSFSEPIIHLTEMAIRDGQLPHARRLLTRLEESGGEPAIVRYLRLMLDCVDRGSPGERWDSAVRTTTVDAFRASIALARAGSQMGCAESGLLMVLRSEASDAEKWGAFLALHGLLAAQGKVHGLSALVDSVAAQYDERYDMQVLLLYLVDALAGVDVHRKADSVVSLLRDRTGETYGNTEDVGLLWLVGSWHALQSDSAMTLTLSRRLDRIAASRGNESSRLYAQSLSAQAALLRADTTQVLAALEALTPQVDRTVLDWSLTESHHHDRLLLAELLLHADRPSDALAVASIFDHPGPIAFLPFLTQSLVLRFRAALALGDRSNASYYRGRLSELGRADILD